MQNDIVLISMSKEDLRLLIRDAIKAELSERKEKKNLLTSKELCNSLDISLSTLSNWKAAGKIPFKRMGKRIYFDLNEVISSMNRPRLNNWAMNDGNNE